LTQEQNKYIIGHIRNRSDPVARLFVTSLTEMASLATFIAMILTWAAIFAAPGV